MAHAELKRGGAELKKHVAAVHMKGNLTLLQRKVSNVLLLNAYDELPDVSRPEHEIRLQTLAEAAGFDSNDHQLLRDALEALVDVKIRWNVLDEQGDEEWGVSSFLAQAVTRNGRCRYAYPPDLRRKLFNPSVYARINLAVQERFAGAYSLALYENCVRYRRVGTTGWIGVDQWRDLLGVGEGQYAAFKYFKRDVILPSVKEVNGESDIRVTPEYRRERRRIVAIKFRVEDHPQQRLDLEPNARVSELRSKRLPNPAELAPSADELFGPAHRRLLAFGLSEAQAIDTVSGYPAELIDRNLAHVESEVARGRRIANVAAFTIQAIRDDYAAAASKKVPVGRPEARPPDTAAVQAEAAEADVARRVREEARQARLDVAWQALSAEEQAEIEREAEERLALEVPFAYALYAKAREKGDPVETASPVARAILRGFHYDALVARGRVGGKGRKEE